MSSARSIVLLSAACICMICAVIAQQAPPSAANIDNDFVQKQFGTNCSLIGLSPIATDLDGDGVEDVVIPARCTNPMMDEAEFGFQVIDPYDAFFGYGNPKITTQFASEDPERRGYVLLVIHGYGPTAWHSQTVKAKFMVVNLPFKQIVVKKMGMKKKRVVMGIFAEETGGDDMTSVIFWDGKKYRYEPLGSSME